MTFAGQPIAVVTGATGFIATELISQLLAKGYLVRATTRDLTKTERLADLKALGEVLPGSLELHQAGLEGGDAYDAVVQGATYVFHLASPVTLQAEDPQRDIVDPAVRGTESLLASVARASPRPKRVVVTSSIAALFGGEGDKAPPVDGSLYGPADWNETSTLETDPYRVSKALAERAAWKLAEEHGIDLVTVLPGYVAGPIISSASATSATPVFTAKIAEGEGFDFTFGVVDVRDVAQIHIAAAENPAANGRYVACTAESYDIKQVTRWIGDAFPFAGAAVVADADLPEIRKAYDNSKIGDDLGIQLRDPKGSFVDLIRSLFAKGIMQPKADA